MANAHAGIVGLVVVIPLIRTGNEPIESATVRATLPDGARREYTSASGAVVVDSATQLSVTMPAADTTQHGAYELQPRIVVGGGVRTIPGSIVTLPLDRSLEAPGA